MAWGKGSFSSRSSTTRTPSRSKTYSRPTATRSVSSYRRPSSSTYNGGSKVVSRPMTKAPTRSLSAPTSNVPMSGILAGIARAAAANRARQLSGIGQAAQVSNAARGLGTARAVTGIGNAASSANAARGVGTASGAIRGVTQGLNNVLAPGSGESMRRSSGYPTTPTGSYVTPTVPGGTPPPSVVPPGVTAPTAPPVIAPTVPTAPTGAFTTTGNGFGTAGEFLRQRLNRGPRSGMSMTPEMLMRLARQRFNRMG